MDFIKKFFILLAVFCVICSVAAISAAYVTDDVNYGWAGSLYGITGDNVSDNNALLNNTTNASVHVVGNASHNASTNATSSHRMLTTGNPILSLLGVLTVLGGYNILRRRE